MEYEDQDIEVIRMLSKLREAESTYPVDMMASRRQSYMKQIAALGIGTGAALAIKEGAKAAGGSSVPPIAGTIVEAALIVAIVAEAGFVAFVNREKVLDFFRRTSVQSTVEQVTALPDDSLPLLDPSEVVETALLVTAEPTLQPTLATVIETPSPGMMIVTEADSRTGTDASGVQVDSTPVPNDDNGNHYGQTPIPERTKENGGGGSNSTNNNGSSGGNGNSGNNGNSGGNGNSNRNNR